MKSTAKTKNIGEVSEFYAFVYILGDRKIRLVDGNLCGRGEYLEFLKLYRSDESYIFLPDSSNLRILSNGQSSIVNRNEIRTEREQLFNLLKKGEKIKLNAPEIQALMQELKTERVSAKSEKKMDFSGEVRLPGSPATQYLGFSVKSNIGANSTLINAGGRKSEVVYRILFNGTNPVGQQLSQLKLWSKQGLKPKELFETLYREKFELQFEKTAEAPLGLNLVMIDSNGPELLARLMWERYQNSTLNSTFVELIGSIAKKNDIAAVKKLGYSEEERFNALCYKFAAILLAFSTGATVGTKWDGKEQASGGMIVVLKSGEVVCLELVTRNAVGQYLLNRSYFENPSTKRHPYGRLTFSEEGSVFVSMQLQVRLKAE